MARYPHLRDSPVTIVSNALLNHGINLYCERCRHKRSWTPAEVATIEPPWRSIWDFKRRRKCSCCGARGSTADVFLNMFLVHSGGSGNRPLDPTPPQLWPGWSRFERRYDLDRPWTFIWGELPEPPA